jgi:hypothetical protein
LAIASDFAPAAAAAGVGELFGLNKSAKVFFSGDADAAGAAAVAGVVIAVLFRALLEAGSVADWAVGCAAAAGDALAAGDASVFAFLRDFLAGDADASAATGDAFSAGEASVLAFLRDFLAGDAAAAGDSPAAGDGD